MKKVISMIASLAIAVSTFSAMAVNVNAKVVDPGIDVAQPYYTYASRADSRISISGKTGTCTSICNGSDVTKIEATQFIERKMPSYYLPLEMWTKTVNGNSLTMTNSRSSLVSDTYRCRTVFKVYKGSSYETFSEISPTAKVN